MPFRTEPALIFPGQRIMQGTRQAPLPVGVFVAAKRRVAAVGPSVVLRAVVGGVHDDGIVSNAQLVEFIEHHANLLVVHNHAIAVKILAALADVLFGDVRPEVHGRCVVPHEERLVGLCLTLHPGESARRNFLIDGFHALLSQRARVLDRLTALTIGYTVQHTARSEQLLERRILGITGQLRLFFCIQVIEVAKKFVEAVHAR